MEAASTVVIKVKYCDVLRRFNAGVVDEKLDLSMDGLREKISSLFSFSPETELILTYIDEDGDVVTFVDDADLCDVIKQALNPLRITVKLKTEKYGRQVSRSTGSSTPLRSPPVQKSETTSDLSEILSTLQEPMREKLVKLFADVASKSATSVPAAAELVENFSKVSLSNPDQLSDSKTKEQPSTQNDATKSSTIIDTATSKVVLESEEKSTKGKESLKEPQSESSMKFNMVQSGYLTSCKIKSGSKAIPSSVGAKTTSADKKKAVMKKVSGCSSGDKSQKTASESSYGAVFSSLGNNITSEQAVNKASKPHSKPKSPNLTPSQQYQVLPGSFPGSGWPAHNGSLSLPWLQPAPRSPYQYPSSGIPLGGMPSVPPHFPFTGYSQYEGRRVVTHPGVRCYCCGVHPITGPRFKSKVKEDFDLCEICFNKMGNNYKDYIRMDIPVPYHTLKANYHPHGGSWYVPQAGRGSTVKNDCASKLSSCFIQHVNVVDGTFMAPLTPFTKIWRMGNNGTTVWPKKTQLIWVGGDKLCKGFTFELDIPEAGIPVDQELDVSVDFISPENPGRYISYWRMASPSGEMFGQCVWFLIQVDASLKEIETIVRNFNLNSLPTCNDANGHEIIVEDLDPIVEDSLPHSDNSNNTVQSVQPVIVSQPNVEHEKKFPINNSLLVGSGASSSVSSPNPNSVPYPKMDFSNVGPVLSSVPPPPPPMVFVSPPPPRGSIVFPKSPAHESPKEVEREQKLLRQLEEWVLKKRILTRRY